MYSKETPPSEHCPNFAPIVDPGNRELLGDLDVAWPRCRRCPMHSATTRSFLMNHWTAPYKCMRSAKVMLDEGSWELYNDLKGYRAFLLVRTLGERHVSQRAQRGRPCQLRSHLPTFPALLRALCGPASKVPSRRTRDTSSLAEAEPPKATRLSYLRSKAQLHPTTLRSNEGGQQPRRSGFVTSRGRPRNVLPLCQLATRRVATCRGAS